MSRTLGRRPRTPTLADALANLNAQLTITPIEAAVVIGQSEHTTRAAIERGDIQALRIGRNYKVLTAPLRRQLGLDVEA